MRIIKIEDKKILDLLDKKADISRRQKQISDEMVSLETEFNKNLSKYARIDEKARPLINKISKRFNLGKYEQISRVHQEETDMSWSVEIADRLEELEARLAEDKKIK
jgi:hypothetical protein